MKIVISICFIFIIAIITGCSSSSNTGVASDGEQSENIDSDLQFEDTEVEKNRDHDLQDDGNYDVRDSDNRDRTESEHQTTEREHDKTEDNEYDEAEESVDIDYGAELEITDHEGNNADFTEEIHDSDSEAEPWWNLWPRFTNHQTVTGTEAVNGNSFNLQGFAAEGRAPFFREWVYYTELKNYLVEMDGKNIHPYIYMEGQGTTSAILGAVMMTEPGIYKSHPDHPIPEVISTHWSWDCRITGEPDWCPDSAIIHDFIENDSYVPVWFSVASYLNPALNDWLSGTANGKPFDFSVNNPLHSLPIPAYPDGTTAAGYFDNDASTPLKAKIYDALATKSLAGDFLEIGESFGDGKAWEDAVNNLANTKGRVYYENYDNSSGTCQLKKQYLSYFTIHKDHANLWWNDYNAKAVEYFVRKGAKGIWTDNYTGWNTIGAWPIKNAFGYWSRASFKDFLTQNSSDLGLDPLNDIVSYLKGKFNEQFGRDPDNAHCDLENAFWEEKFWLNDPWWKAYMVHKSNLAHEFAKDYYTKMKNMVAKYENETGVSPEEFCIGGNEVPGLAFAALKGDEVDMANTEYNPGWSLQAGEIGTGLPPKGHSGPFYAVATNAAKSRHAVIWYYLDHKEHLPYKNSTVLGEVLGFEALANNTFLLSGDANHRIAGSDESALAVNNAIEKLAPYFGKRERSGKVAILYSNATQHSFLTPGGFYGFSSWEDSHSEKEKGYLNHNLGYFGWGAVLEELHLPYRAIPDYKLSKKQLLGIKVLILPHIRSIDPEAVENIIKPFLNAGNAVIVTGQNSGSIKTKKYFYKNNSSNLLNDLVNGSYSSGGKAVFVSGNPGMDFLVGREKIPAKREPALNSIADTFINLIESGNYELELDTERADAEGTISDKIHTVTHWNMEKGIFFIDFVNENIVVTNITEVEAGTEETAEIPPLAPTSSMTIKVKLPEYFKDKVLEMTVLNPDKTQYDKVVIPVSTDENGVFEIMVPSFRVFASLMFETVPNVFRPSVSAAGYGCEENQCLWITGKNFSPNSYISAIEVDSNSSHEIKNGLAIAPDGKEITINLSAAGYSDILNLFRTEEMYITVVTPLPGGGTTWAVEGIITGNWPITK